MSKIEKNGGISYPSFLVNTQEPLANEFAQLRQEREQKELQQKLTELAKQKQDELDAKLANLELLPMGSKIIILPYPENPYRKVMSGSIIVDYTGSFINPDTGERDKLKELSFLFVAPQYSHFFIFFIFGSILLFRLCNLVVLFLVCFLFVLGQILLL